MPEPKRADLKTGLSAWAGIAAVAVSSSTSARTPDCRVHMDGLLVENWEAEAGIVCRRLERFDFVTGKIFSGGLAADRGRRGIPIRSARLHREEAAWAATVVPPRI